ncbi:hypothetical protein RB195_018803 [Necator americanus]|uniref:Uncharacterized protein n=1 Tax=Necator americanus TaxID=51031 RepID=A0ABR1CBB7_NECAM
MVTRYEGLVLVNDQCETDPSRPDFPVVYSVHEDLYGGFSNPELRSIRLHRGVREPLQETTQIVVDVGAGMSRVRQIDERKLPHVKAVELIADGSSLLDIVDVGGCLTCCMALF